MNASKSHSPAQQRTRLFAGRAGRIAAAAGGLLATVCLAAAACAQASRPAPPPLPLEDNDTATLAPGAPHRLFLFDAYLASAVNVIDADDADLKTLGMIDVSLNATLTASRDARKIYVVETYWSHGNRGDRADLLTIYDGLTLKVEKEIPLPGRLLVEPKPALSATSDDERLAYVYDMIPGSSVHVVDIDAGKVVTSVDLPGCSLAYAFGPRSFASICGDGTISVVAVPQAGPAKAVFSQKFFDPDNDPVFESSVVDRTTGEAWFVSFTGKIYPAQLGATPVLGAPWTITGAAGMPPVGTGVQELAWRPGGDQLIALHRASKRLFVLMHAGNFWTHKADGTEVWVLDARTRTLVRRISLSQPAKTIAVTQDEHPILIASGGKTGFVSVYNADTGALLREKPLAGHFEVVPGL